MDIKQMEAEALKNFEKFFRMDMQTKEELLRLEPTVQDNMDEETKIAYIDRLYKSLKDMEAEFLEVARNFNLSQECIESIKKQFKAKEVSFLVTRFDLDTIKKLYFRNLLEMDEKLIDEVRGEIFGYKIDVDVNKLIQKSRSINELLHILHSYICNSHEIMSNLPVIDSKLNRADEPVILFGKETEISRMIYDAFPIELDCDNVDIVSLQNKILMMVRGRGHALTMDIDTSKEDQILVKYFVPLIKNQEMVDALPGLNKSGLNRNGAVGMFQTSKEKLTSELFGFIEKVPTDADNPVVKKYRELAERLNAANEER